MGFGSGLEQVRQASIYRKGSTCWWQGSVSLRFPVSEPTCFKQQEEVAQEVEEKPIINWLEEGQPIGQMEKGSPGP